MIQDRQAAGIATVVVHSGDLTVAGSNAEFAVGKTFLEGGHHAQPGRRIGLGLAERSSHTRLLDIPGNHDLWSRNSPRDSNAFSQHYGGPYPRVIEIVSKSGKALFYGLDSNRSSRAQHRLANGEIPPAQLTELAHLMARYSGQSAVHIVSIHHPVFVERRIAPTLAGREILKLRNREAIARKLRDLRGRLPG